MSLTSILTSEYVLATFFIGFLGLIGFMTYSFGFQQQVESHDEPEAERKSSKTKPRDTKARKVEKKPETVASVVVEPVKKADEASKVVKKAEVKKSEAAKKQVKKEDRKVMEEPVVQVAVEENSVDASEWTTVVDKRAQKKQKSTTPNSSTDNEEPAPSKSKAKKPKVEKPVEEVISNDQLVIGSKLPSELLTNSVIAKTETKEKEDDWIPANPKAKKDKKPKKEVAKETVPLPEVKPQVVPIVPEVKEVEKTKAKKGKKQAQQSLASAIQDAIVDTIESKVNLKQTTLTDSMILVESVSKRTESNQSSNESLQDVDGDDGFITITNKKSKRAVRREQ